MIKAVIFDCFGVVISEAVSVIIDEFSQVNPVGAQEIRDLYQASNKGLIPADEAKQHIATILGLDYDAYLEKVRGGEVKDPRVLELILTLRQQYKTALLSNMSIEGMNRRFTASEQAIYFDVMVASASIGHAKPEPEAYLIAAERLGIELAECIFLDDKEFYCQAARQVGMQAVWYQDFTQAKADLESILT